MCPKSVIFQLILWGCVANIGVIELGFQWLWWRFVIKPPPGSVRTHFLLNPLFTLVTLKSKYDEFHKKMSSAICVCCFLSTSMCNDIVVHTVSLLTSSLQLLRTTFHQSLKWRKHAKVIYLYPWYRYDEWYHKWRRNICTFPGAVSMVTKRCYRIFV